MSWEKEVILKIADVIGRDVTLDSVSAIGGGSINDTYKIATNEGNFFLKKNLASLYPEMFEKEELGIKLLEQTNEITVPEIISTGEINNTSFLILDYIESGVIESNFWPEFGSKLANLHKHSSGFFGLDYNNYIGSLIQSNTKHLKWNEFFINERLNYQVKLARDSGKVGNDYVKNFDRFYRKLENIFPIEPPALVHGDLWSGNFMVNNIGQPVIIDPAVYYGHREMDLGMSKLFGGFDRQFYDSYNDHYPLEVGWRERLQYCNLYPLMVHVNLFGGSYLNSVKEILSRF